jgi:cation transport ATPase
MFSNWVWVAFLVWLDYFSCYFSDEFKTHGTVSLYFEATTVILTLVLLGQLLEARAHSQTSGAIKIVEINNRSHFGHRRTDKVISIHDIKRRSTVKPVIKFLWMGKYRWRKYDR